MYSIQLRTRSCLFKYPIYSGVTDRVVNQLLTELDGVEGLKGDGTVMLLGLSFL